MKPWGWTVEDSRRWWLDAECDGGECIRSQIEKQDLKNIQCEGNAPTTECSDDERSEFGNVVGEVESQEAADILESRAPLLDRSHDGGEVVVEQDEIGRLASDVRTAPSRGDADISLTACRSIVHDVSRHRHDMTTCLECTRDTELILWRDASDDHLVSVDERTESGIVRR